MKSGRNCREASNRDPKPYPMRGSLCRWQVVRPLASARNHRRGQPLDFSRQERVGRRAPTSRMPAGTSLSNSPVSSRQELSRGLNPHFPFQLLVCLSNNATRCSLWQNAMTTCDWSLTALVLDTVLRRRESTRAPFRTLATLGCPMSAPYQVGPCPANWTGLGTGPGLEGSCRTRRRTIHHRPDWHGLGDVPDEPWRYAHATTALYHPAAGLPAVAVALCQSHGTLHRRCDLCARASQFYRAITLRLWHRYRICGPSLQPDSVTTTWSGPVTSSDVQMQLTVAADTESATTQYPRSPSRHCRPRDEVIGPNYDAITWTGVQGALL